MSIVRVARAEDLPSITAIYNDIIVNTTAVFSYDPHTPAMRSAWYKSKLDAGFPVFVAEEGNSVVGFASIGPFRDWPAYQFTVENSVYVQSARRGTGIGKQLLQTLIDAARKLNKHTIIASIEGTNTASLRLHQSFGFEEVACFRQVGYKFDRWLDLKFLQLMLEDAVASRMNYTRYA